MHLFTTPRLVRARITLLTLGCLCFAAIARARAQAAAADHITVVGQELPSAYGAPPAFSRTRFAPITTAYVLPPGSVLAATIYDGDVFRKGIPANSFTQEIEVGLPYRFGVAIEAELEHYNGITQGRSVSLEARYALADWNKIPLNPTLFAEYKFGTGRILRDEALNQPDEEEGMPAPDTALRRLSLGGHSHHVRKQDAADDEASQPDLPDAVEGRLLLSQDFGEHLEWAMNLFFEQETGGDRGREWGFAQSIVAPLNRAETFTAGVEMQYLEFSDKGIRDEPEQRFVIGPTIGWKPARWCRLDVSELFGCTPDSERA
ncbi:MAG: hypothetical protein DLM52_05110, partial [Chthoniobacterales bacterium]